MAYISKEQLLQVSYIILQKYAELPEFAGKVIYKIDPKILAQKVLGLKLTHHRLSKDLSILGFSTSVSGVGMQMYDYEDETIYIMVDDHTIVVDDRLIEQNIGRYNFTIMHEIAHHIINHFFYKQKSAAPHYYRLAKSGGDWEEWQADKLASYLLLPKLCIDRGMDMFDINSNCISEVAFRLTYLKYRFEELAKFLGVSKEALKIRMKDLGYMYGSNIQNCIMECDDGGN